MGLNFVKWFKERLKDGTEQTKNIEIDWTEFFGLMDNVYIRELAFWTCVNKIANAISKCEFRTYYGYKEVKKSEYYLWNIEPNRNQNASAFMTKLIGKLYLNNEALVIESSGQLYVADSFNKTVYALYDYQFDGVTVDNFTFGKTFYQGEVLYFQLNSADMRKLVNLLYSSYNDLMQYAANAYRKSRGSRGILNIDAQAQAEDDFSEKLAELMTNYFKKFFESENAVLPLYDGYEYNEIQTKTYSSESTRDIKALADDIFDFTARAASFPPSLAKGDVQDTGKATDELLTFCIDPLARMLEKEINRKRNGLYGLLNGNYLKIDTTAVKHIDIFDIATPVDKLISSGAFTINDIRRIIGEPPIDEEWANQHFITKNYSTVQDLLEALKTGKEPGKKGSEE
ncbi:MAG: phage portal protein [Lachnospiraceae bacterium]